MTSISKVSLTTGQSSKIKWARMCRCSFAMLDGFPKDRVDLCSTVLKKNFNSLTLRAHNPFKDSTVHEYSFGDAADIFEQHIEGWTLGKFRFVLLTIANSSIYCRG